MTSNAEPRRTARVIAYSRSAPSAQAVPLWASTILVLWGVAAFGAVYDWARIPLLLGAGISALVMVRQMRRRDIGGILVSAVVLAAAAAQSAPMPSALRGLIATRDAFLSQYEVGNQNMSGWQPISIARGETVSAALKAAALAFFCLTLAACLRRDSRTALSIARSVALIAVAVALEAVVQKGSFNEKIYWFWTGEAGPYGTNNYFGPFINRNHFAGWMILAGSLVAGLVIGVATSAGASLRSGWRNRALWLSSREVAAVILLATGLLAMTVSLVWSRSRSGIAGGAVATVMLAIAAGVRMKGAGRRLLVPLLVLALFVAAVAWKGAESLASWYTTTDTLQWRFNQWHDAMAPLRDFWLTGSGLGTYGILTLVYPQTDTTLHAAQAHNDYLQLAVEGGLLVGIPVLIAIGALIYTIGKRLSTPQDERIWWIRLGAVAGICGIGVQELTDFSLQIPGVAMLFAVVVAIAIHEPESPERRRTAGS
jgi:O-antigen ligase